MNTRKKITLEPALETQVIDLDAEERRRLGHVYLRWARQLFVSAKILERDAKPKARRTVPVLHPKKAALN